MKVGDRRAEAGSSSIGSVFGVAIFLAFLLLTSQALVHLYATSVVTAVAFDAARRASASASDCPTAARVRERLGSWGRQGGVTVRCERDATGVTRVSIAGPSPAAAFDGFGTAFGLGGGEGLRIERSAVFHTEELE